MISRAEQGFLLNSSEQREEALALIDATDERTFEADLYRTKGELLLLQGRAETEIEVRIL